MDLSNEINIDNLNKENRDCFNFNFNTLNQNINESIQIEKKELDQKEISNLSKKGDNILSVKSYKYIFNDLNDNIKEIINAPKYNSLKRSKSDYSNKSLKENFQMKNLKIPSVKYSKYETKDPTTQIIIRNLEQKIEILEYENNLLNKKFKDLYSNNKELEVNSTDKILLINSGHKIDNKKLNFEKDDDLHHEIIKVKNENIKLKKENEILSADNIGLIKIIENFQNNKNLIQIQSIEKIEKSKNLLKKMNNDILIEEHRRINQRDNQINESINPNLELNLLFQEEYNQLLDENKELKLKLQNLLSIDKENYLNNNHDNISILELINENLSLKEKIDELNNKINEINNEQNLKIKEKYEECNSNLIEEKNNLNENKDLEVLFNEIILMGVKQDDEDTKNIINKIQNIRDINEKRKSQCILIKNKLKILNEENALLRNKLLSAEKWNNDLINKNKKNCFCNNNISYEYLIKLLKKKDKIIQKCKDKEEENELKNKKLMEENYKLMEIYNNMEEENTINNNIKYKINDRFDDYSEEKIIQAQPIFRKSKEFFENNKNIRYNNFY